MVTENYERMGRKLMEHHRKLNWAAVGTRSMACELVLSRQWDDARGQLTVLHVSMPEQMARPDVARLLAQAILGRASIAAHEVRGRQFGRFELWFVIELDQQWQQPQGAVQLQRPSFVRWFDAEKLGKPLGDQHQGHCTLHGRSMVRVSE